MNMKRDQRESFSIQRPNFPGTQLHALVFALLANEKWAHPHTHAHFLYVAERAITHSPKRPSLILKTAYSQIGSYARPPLVLLSYDKVVECLSKTFLLAYLFRNSLLFIVHKSVCLVSSPFNCRVLLASTNMFSEVSSIHLKSRFIEGCRQ